MTRFVLIVLAALTIAESGLGAESFRWKGRVDGVDDILIKGRSVRVEHREAKPVREQDYRFSASLPSRSVEISLRKIKGRGKVRLMEQPSERNDYTAVVRIEDDKGGDGKYEFELRWEQDDDSDDDNRDDLRRYDGAFRWKGRVDIGVEIRIRGGRHELKDMGGKRTQETRARFDEPLPAEKVVVSLDKKDGRGDVRLIESPNAGNNYTALIRIKDDKGGADTYEFELRWKK